MMLKHHSILLLGLLLLNLSCGQRGSTIGNIHMSDLSNEELISYFNSFSPLWKRAIQTNDAKYIIAQYDENAIIEIPDKEVLIGKQAIAEYWNKVANFLVDFHYETKRIGGNPDEILYENGIAYTSYILDNKIVTDTSKYLFVWEYVGDKKYKVLAEMFTDY